MFLVFTCVFGVSSDAGSWKLVTRFASWTREPGLLLTSSSVVLPHLQQTRLDSTEERRVFVYLYNILPTTYTTAKVQ